MKKNNKGFTLVELLAALVILGVLATIALPTVVNMLGNSRDKLYVTDAKKLISQAEYKFRVASSEIEKPDDGECLILSMVYLDNSDFDNAPNNGEYVREASYVLIKNNGGEYEFSVELVEEIKKGSFKGVELSKSSTLNTNSTRHVVSFNKNHLYFVESNSVMGKYNGKQIDTSYINSKLGGSYISGITKVYNYPDLADSTYNANYAIPKIIRAEYVSASNKNFNSLDAILKVVATDVDTPTDDLIVFVGPGRGGRYPSLNAPLCEKEDPYNFTECKYEYGSLSDFSLKVDFSENNYDYSGQTASLYIIVVDPEGNTDRINPVYKIHTNEPPVIDMNKSGVFRKSTDFVNLSSAVLRLHVSDDSTPVGGLEYCITENKDATSCDGYKPFTDFNNSEMNYTFSCGSECVYDGRTLNLKVFLRDKDPTNPLETTATFSYNLFKNDVPIIVSLELESEDLPFVDNDSKSLTADVSLIVSDYSSSSNITVILDEDPNFNKNPQFYTYSAFAGNVSYTFSGLYDGKERILYAKVIDEYSFSTVGHVSYGAVHKNNKPVIDNVTVTSQSLLEYVCPNSQICDKYPNNGGAYEVRVDVSASDDLVSDENLMICISEDESKCSNINSGNFIPYLDGKTAYLTLSSGATRFNGETKKIYVSVYDGYGVAADNSYNYSQYSDLKVNDYLIYKNHAPEIDEDEFSIVSENIDYNFMDVLVKFKVNDDLDAINTLDYKIYDDAGGTPVTGVISATSVDDLNEVEFTFGGDYDGEERTLTIEVYDSYNAVAKVTKKYAVHKNEAPTINYVTLESIGTPCTSDACTNGNSINAKVKFTVTDDLDVSMKDLLLCVSSKENECTNYKKIKEYTGFEENNNEFSFSHVITTGELPYKGETKYVYLFVKDRYGDIGKKSGSYILYNNTKANIDLEYPVVKSSNYEEVRVEISEEESYVTNKNPNITTVNFELKASDEFIDKSQLKYQICYVENIENDITDPSLVKCLENNKFYDYGSNTISTQALDLGITAYEGQQFFIFAKVYDDYAYACAMDSSKCGEEDYISYSSLAFYQVYQDIEPEISKFTLSRLENSLSYDTLNVTFNVTDILDTFTYCISESETECTNYSSTVYSGDSTNDVVVTYNPGWDGPYDPDSSRNYLVYLHIKDSHGNVTVSSTFPERIPCDAVLDDEGNLIDSGTVQDSIVYELKSGSEEITAAKCSNKCYYWNSEETGESTETANIVAYYKRTVTFLDKDDSAIVCNKDVDENYEARCNFKSCYYNAASNNYVVTAIGYIEHENTDSSVIHTVGEDTHIPTHYRNEYITDYKEDSDMIVLTPTGNKICGKCFDEGAYSGTIITYDNNLQIEE